MQANEGVSTGVSPWRPSPPRGRLTVAWQFYQGASFAGRRPLLIAAPREWGPRGPRMATPSGRVPRGPRLRVVGGRTAELLELCLTTLPPGTLSECGFRGPRVRAQVLHFQRAPQRPLLPGGGPHREVQKPGIPRGFGVTRGSLLVSSFFISFEQLIFCFILS